MREILFRGKRIEDGQWVEGHYHFANWYLPTSMEIVDRTHHILQIGRGDADKIDPETVGQFTGLTDKNGKKIFEGDVVLYPWNDQDKPERFTIKFKYGQFVASPVKENEDYWDFMVGGYSKEMEIIGNIHDNPELLENT